MKERYANAMVSGRHRPDSHGNFRWRGAAAVVLGATLAGLGIVTGPTGAGAAPAKKTTTTSVTNANAVAISNPGELWTFAAQGFGEFGKEHLKVANIWNTGGSLALSEVATGKAQFGETSITDYINAVEAGEPLHAFAELITHSIYSTAVLKSSGITKYSQLAGKNVGMTSLTSGSYPASEETMAANHLTGKVHETVAGLGGAAAQALQNGSIAALTTFDTQWAELKHLGLKLHFLPSPKVLTYPSDVYYTTNSYYKSHVAVVDRYAAAVFAGISEAKKNPLKAVYYFETEYPQTASGTSLSEDLSELKARLKDVELAPQQHGKWGYFPSSLTTRRLRRRV